MHVTSSPSILYFGTPVALLSTNNEDGSANLAPMSSIFWLGWRCFIGLQSTSKTTLNLRRTGQVVINLPSALQVEAVDRLALTTGTSIVPQDKIERGYRYVADKFERAGLTPVASETVLPPRAAECPVQMEAVLERADNVVLELRITRVHVEQSILMTDNPNRIDPDKWRPLIMSFQQFYGLGEKLHPSRLGLIPEDLYRGPDYEKAVVSLMEGADQRSPAN